MEGEPKHDTELNADQKVAAVQQKYVPSKEAIDLLGQEALDLLDSLIHHPFLDECEEFIATGVMTEGESIEYCSAQPGFSQILDGFCTCIDLVTSKLHARMPTYVDRTLPIEHASEGFRIKKVSHDNQLLSVTIEGIRAIFVDNMLPFSSLRNFLLSQTIKSITAYSLADAFRIAPFQIQKRALAEYVTRMAKDERTGKLPKNKWSGMIQAANILAYIINSEKMSEALAHFAKEHGGDADLSKVRQANEDLILEIEDLSLFRKSPVGSFDVSGLRIKLGGDTQGDEQAKRSKLINIGMMGIFANGGATPLVTFSISRANGKAYLADTFIRLESIFPEELSARIIHTALIYQKKALESIPEDLEWLYIKSEAQKTREASDERARSIADQEQVVADFLAKAAQDHMRIEAEQAAAREEQEARDQAAEVARKAKEARRTKQAYKEAISTVQGEASDRVIAAIEKIFDCEGRKSGSHRVFVSPRTRETISIPDHGSKPVGKGLLGKELKKAQLTPMEILENLP